MAAASQQTYAADITIQSGTTVTATQTLTDPGDTGLVEEGGTIDVTDGDGFFLGATNQTATNNGTIEIERTAGVNIAGMGSSSTNSTVVNNGTIIGVGEDAYGIAGDQTGFNATNNGTISTSGEDGFGIFSLGNGAVLTNNGTISTTGLDAFGIHSDGTDAVVTNSGSISTTGNGSFGIVADGDRSSVTNSGTVTTSGNGSNGIVSLGANASLTNSGTITVTGQGSDGMDTDGVNAVLSNSGTITASGRNGNGMDVSGNNSRMTNTGAITVSGEDSNGLEASANFVVVTNSGTIRNTGAKVDVDEGHGISIVGNNASVTNSGAIYSANGSSIYIDGADASVTLEKGTILQGLLSFTTPASASVNYNVGRTAILTFNSLPNTINTNGLSSWTSGNTITILSADDFHLSSQNAVATNLTRELAGSLEDRLREAREVPLANVATHGDGADLGTGTSYWATPFGTLMDRQGNSGFEHVLGGVLAGADKSLDANTRAGIAGGFSFGETRSKNVDRVANAYSLFGAAYANRSWQDLFADVTLTAGYMRSDDDVTVLNNMVTGGLQDLSVGYDYVFVSPSVRFGRDIPINNAVVTPSARVRYSGLWQAGNAAESVTRFETDNRSLHVLEVRGMASYRFEKATYESSRLDIGFDAGLDAAFTLSDTVDASFNGAALNLSLDEDTVLRGFARASAVWQSDAGAQLRADLEGGYDSAQTLSASVRVGLSAPF